MTLATNYPTHLLINFKFLLVAVFTAVAAVMVVHPGASVAQEFSVLAPMQPTYRIGGFNYSAPGADGFRQVAAASSGFRIVYAVQHPDERIETLADIVAEAFAISDAERQFVGDVATLAEVSERQQVAEREGRVKAFSRVAPVETASDVYSFTIVTKLDERDLFEVFFLGLARDKSEYFIAKMSTTETDHAESDYFGAFVSSLASLRHDSDSPKREPVEVKNAPESQPEPQPSASEKPTATNPESSAEPAQPAQPAKVSD